MKNSWKNETLLNETACKSYKSLFEAIKGRSKNNYYSQRILQVKHGLL